MLFLFKVEDVFRIEGRGCLLVPGLAAGPDAREVRKGARIELHTPTGKVFKTTIYAIAMISYRKPPERRGAPILLPEEIKKEDIPIGTEFFWVED